MLRNDVSDSPSITVYCWNNCAWPHVSIHFTTGKEQVYLSFGGEDTYEKDLEQVLWKPKSLSLPIKTDKGVGLDVNAMIEWHKQSSYSHPKQSSARAEFSYFQNNCATAVCKILTEGGAQKLLKYEKPIFGINRPGEIFDYCKKIASLANQTSLDTSNKTVNAKLF